VLYDLLIDALIVTISSKSAVTRTSTDITLMKLLADAAKMRLVTL